MADGGKYPNQRPRSSVIVDPNEIRAQELSKMLRERERKILKLEEDLRRVQDDKEILEKMFHFPAQFRAGCVEIADRRPFNFLQRKELKNGDNTFGYGAPEGPGIVQATFEVSVNNPTYGVRVRAALIRTAHNAEIPANKPVGVYLPLGGISPEGNILGLGFKWWMSTSSDDRPFQSDYRDSIDIDPIQGYQFPAEQPLYAQNTITIYAQPWTVRDDENGEQFSLFFSLDTYKMYEVYPASA